MIVSIPNTLADVTSAGLSLALIPTDPASVFVYLLVLVSGYMIWRGSRGGKKEDGTPPGAA